MLLLTVGDSVYVVYSMRTLHMLNNTNSNSNCTMRIYTEV
jgi:hypothetical protein